MPNPLIAICIFTPLLDIYLLVLIGNKIGALTIILLILCTAIIGITVLRLQSVVTLAKIRKDIEEGILPTLPLLEGLMLFIAGIFLFIPGLLTDVFGSLFLIPALRSRVALSILRRFLVRQQTSPRDKIILRDIF